VKNSPFPALCFLGDYFEKADFRLNLALKPFSASSENGENEPQVLKKNYSRLMRAKNTFAPQDFAIAWISSLEPPSTTITPSAYNSD
jgi:hypothetical protein